MKAYIVQSDKVVEPFGDHPQDCLIRNKTLKALQNETLLGLGLQPLIAPNAEQIDVAMNALFSMIAFTSLGAYFRSLS